MGAWIRRTVIGGLVIATGGAATAALAYRGPDVDIATLTIGVTVVLVGGKVCTGALLYAAIRKPRLAADEAFELGYQMGEDKGYREGRRAGRPVVVSLDSPARREVAGARRAHHS